MRFRRSGFTLLEVLVVLGVVALLTGLLFPVFTSAKAKAQSAVCASSFHQAQLAMALYIGDYDDTFAPINHQPGLLADSSSDRTWVQLLMPYAKSFSIFRCPSDPDPDRMADAMFDKDLVPADLVGRFYSASLRTNLGYNFLYLSPVFANGMNWQATPRTASQVGQPSQVLLFVDSVGSVSPSGRPAGGGSWLVVPPCRYAVGTSFVADTFGVMGRPVFAPSLGWTVGQPISATTYGMAWPWHSGRATVVTVDGAVRAVSPQELARGCEVRSDWAGNLTLAGDYQWDLE